MSAPYVDLDDYTDDWTSFDEDADLVPCPSCRGTGYRPVGPFGQEPECRRCAGSGEVVA